MLGCSNDFDIGVPARSPLKGELLGEELQLVYKPLQLSAAEFVAKHYELISNAGFLLVAQVDPKRNSKQLPLYTKCQQPLMGHMHGFKHGFMVLVEDGAINDASGYRLEALELHFNCGLCPGFAGVVSNGLAIPLQSVQKVQFQP